MFNPWPSSNLPKLEVKCLNIKTPRFYMTNQKLSLVFGYRCKMPQLIMVAFGEYQEVIKEFCTKDIKSSMVRLLMRSYTLKISKNKILSPCKWNKEILQFFQADLFTGAMKIPQTFQDTHTHGIWEIKRQSGHLKIGYKEKSSRSSHFQTLNDDKKFDFCKILMFLIEKKDI